MNPNRLRLVTLATAGFLLGVPSSQAGIVRFTATIDGAQDGTASTSTGTAAMIYDVTTNKFDLTVTISNFPNPLTNSHIHEAAPGVAGPIVVPFGAEVVYTRTGNTLTGTFTNVTYTGTPATLLSGGAYLNYHTTAFPAGEIRGRLVSQPVKLTASMTPGQETGTAVVSNAYGAAQATYDPMTNQITTLVCVYNYTNTLTASHIHEGPFGVAGPVRRDFGAAAAYTNNGTSYVQLFSNQTYNGTPSTLLSEGGYVNVHSNIYPAGEIRGQLYVTNPTNPGRLINVSSRAQIGTGNNVLISGFFIQGNEPARVLVSGRGPSFASLVPGTVADPAISVYDTAGRQIFSNDNIGTAPLQSLITAVTGVSFTTAEAGGLLVLPAGGYTILVSGAGSTTGVGIGEAFELGW